MKVGNILEAHDDGLPKFSLEEAASHDDGLHAISLFMRSSAVADVPPVSLPDHWQEQKVEQNSEFEN